MVISFFSKLVLAKEYTMSHATAFLPVPGLTLPFLSGSYENLGRGEPHIGLSTSESGTSSSGRNSSPGVARQLLGSDQYRVEGDGGIYANFEQRERESRHAGRSAVPDTSAQLHQHLTARVKEGGLEEVHHGTITFMLTRME